MVYGDFATRRLGIGKVNPGEALDVEGSINLSGRLKYKGTVVLATNSCNTFVGEDAGVANTANNNTFVGWHAGESNTTGIGNVFIGTEAGHSNEGGAANTFVGMNAGRANISGEGNSCFGIAAGKLNTSGSFNTSVGNWAGWSNTEGSSNVCIGADAGGSSHSGNNNTFLGTTAGFNNMAGSGNVFLGYAAGFHATGSDKLYIANGQGSEDVLIYGDFSTGRVGLGTLAPEHRLHVRGNGARVLIDATDGNSEVNLRTAGDEWFNVWAIYKHVDDGDLHFFQGSDKVTIQGGTGCVAIGADDPQGYRLYVQGQAYASGGWQACDLRLKTDLLGIDDALGKVLRLSGRSFRWRTEEYPDRGFPEGRHYGLVAQEVEQVLPEAVGRGPGDEKALAYSELIPVLVEAVKELKAENDDLRSRLETLEKTHAGR